MSLTGSFDTDLELLLKLDLQSLERVCRLNTFFSTICQNDLFWRDKVEKDFGRTVLRYKPLDETYRQQYLFLSYMLQTQADIEQDRPEGREFRWEQGMITGQDVTDYAASSDRADLLFALFNRGVPIGRQLFSIAGPTVRRILSRNMKDGPAS